MDHEKILAEDNKLEDDFEAERPQEKLEETCRLDYGYVLNESERFAEGVNIVLPKFPWQVILDVLARKKQYPGQRRPDGGESGQGNPGRTPLPLPPPAGRA